LLSLEAWRSAIRLAQIGERPNGGIPAETREALDGLQKDSERVYEILSTLAPERIVGLASISFRTLFTWAYAVDAKRGNKENSPIRVSDSNTFINRSYRHNKQLRDAIRQDLGVDLPLRDEDPPSSM